jgi:patatin-like phospholipase/acyl hydrolase
MSGESNRFRVSTLDGKGLKGSLTAALLAEGEGSTGRSIVGHFDLITGTSTGGIVSLALGLSIPASR